MDTIISNIQDDPTFLARYNDAIRIIRECGLEEVLRDQAKIRLVSPSIDNYEEVQMARANWCAGYSDALDDLFSFKTRFLENQPITNPKKAVMDFGGRDRAVKLGLITEEEARNYGK